MGRGPPRHHAKKHGRPRKQEPAQRPEPLEAWNPSVGELHEASGGLAPGPGSGGSGGDIRGSKPTPGAAAATRLDSWHFSEMLASAFYDLSMRHSASYMRHV